MVNGRPDWNLYGSFLPILLCAPSFDLCQASYRRPTTKKIENITQSSLMYSETEQSLLSSSHPSRGRRTPGVWAETEQRTQYWAEQNFGWLSSCSLLAPTTTIPSPYSLAWHCTAFTIDNRGEGRVQILGSYLCNFGWHNNSVCTLYQYPHPLQHSVCIMLSCRGLSRPVLVASICLAKLDSALTLFRGRRIFRFPLHHAHSHQHPARDSAILNLHFYN